MATVSAGGGLDKQMHDGKDTQKSNMAAASCESEGC